MWQLERRSDLGSGPRRTVVIYGALMRRIFLLTLALTACSVGPSPKPAPDAKPLPRATRLDAVAASQRDVFFVRSEQGKCSLAAIDRASRAVRSIRELDFCPDGLRLVGTDSLLFSTAMKAEWLSLTGDTILPGVHVIAATDRDHYAFVRAGHVWLKGGADEVDLGSETGLTKVRVLADGSGIVAVAKTNAGYTLTRLSASGKKDILPSALPAIDSFDISPSGTEIVVSARRQSFDVGIVSSDGGEPRWIGTDPSDETTVTWAPRGNKVSWVIHTFGGDVFRTVHIPTAFSLLADSEGGSVREVAWEPEAERFVYVSSSPSASDEIVEMRYGGEERTVLVPAKTTLADFSLEGWPEAGPTSLLAPPLNARYGHVYPLVIWAGTALRAWSDARAAVRSLGGIGIAFTSEVDKQLFDAVAQLPWVDQNSVTIVSFAPVDLSAVPAGSHLAVIEPDPAGNETVVRDETNTIRARVSGAAADVVESVAARTIIGQTKGPAAADAKH